MYETFEQERKRMFELRAGLSGALALAVLLASAGDASAATRYAEPNGDGPAGTCPKSNPCDLQVAAEAGSGASGADEVILAPGTYDLGADQLVPAQGIKVGGERGASEPARIVSSHSVAVLVEFNADTLVHDVRIEHSGDLAALYLIGGKAERVFAKTTGGSTACRGSSFGVGFLRDSVCWNATTAAGIRAGFTLDTDSNASDSRTYKIRNVTAVASGGGASTAYGLNLDVDVAGSGTPGLVLDAQNVIALGANADVRSKTGCNGPCGTGQASAAVNLTNSNYSTVVVTGINASITQGGTNGNQSAEPVFADVVAGDFRQQPTSPTIDAGNTSADLLGEFDFLGSARVAGPAIDIGAHEFDDDPPAVTLTKTPPAKTTRRKATFKFVATEVATFECSLDGKAFRPCGSPRKYGRVKPGAHTFDVTATDLSGNEGEMASYQWKVKRR